MMKPNELRIGNLILDNKEVKKVTSGMLSNWDIIKRDYGGYNPIPLTEEWLLKFGFFKNDQYVKNGNGAEWQPEYPRTTFDGYNIEVFEDTYFAIVYSLFEYKQDDHVSKSNDVQVVFGDYYPTQMDSSHFLNVSIKYVHQLQNLYFALTGEELELKEKQKDE